MNRRQDWILFYVYGRVGYAYLAANAAISIRANGVNLPIKLCVCQTIYDKLNDGVFSLFDKVEIIKDSDLFLEGGARLDKCYAKLGFWKYAEGNGVNIFIDADSLVLKDEHFPEIISLAEKQGITFGWIGKGKYDSKLAWGERVTSYSKFFNVNLKDEYITAVSSYLVAFDTTLSFDGLIDTYKEYLSYSKLRHTDWQSSIPDELIWQIYVNRVGLNEREFEYPINAVSTMSSNIVDYENINKSSIMTFIGHLGSKAASYYNNLITSFASKAGRSVPTYYMDKKMFTINENIFLNRGKKLYEEYRRNY